MIPEDRFEAYVSEITSYMLGVYEEGGDDTDAIGIVMLSLCNAIKEARPKHVWVEE